MKKMTVGTLDGQIDLLGLPTEKEEAIQNYMNYLFQTPEFQEKLRKSILHYIDTGEINA